MVKMTSVTTLKHLLRQQASKKASLCPRYDNNIKITKLKSGQAARKATVHLWRRAIGQP